MTAAKTSSLRAFARRRRVDEKAVRKAVTSGRLTASIGRDKRGRPFIADLTLADQEWKQNAGRTGPDDAQTPKATIISTNTLVEAQRSVARERERKLRLENDLREGRLVDVAKANRVAFESSRTIRKAVMNIPSRLSAELAAESDPSRVYTKLEAALREALTSAADNLMAAAGE